MLNQSSPESNLAKDSLDNQFRKAISCNIGRNRLTINIVSCKLGYMIERTEFEHDSSSSMTIAMLCKSKIQLIDALNKDPYKTHFADQLSQMVFELNKRLN